MASRHLLVSHRVHPLAAVVAEEVEVEVEGALPVRASFPKDLHIASEALAVTCLRQDLIHHPQGLA